MKYFPEIYRHLEAENRIVCEASGFDLTYYLYGPFFCDSRGRINKDLTGRLWEERNRHREARGSWKHFNLTRYKLEWKLASLKLLLWHCRRYSIENRMIEEGRRGNRLACK